MGGHQILDHDQDPNCTLARDRQQKVCDLVREPHALTVPRIESRNLTLLERMTKTLSYLAGLGLGLNNAAVTIRQGVLKDTDDKVLQPNFRLTGPVPSKYYRSVRR